MSRYDCHSYVLRTAEKFIPQNNSSDNDGVSQGSAECSGVRCRVVAVWWWYDTGGCYNDTISRVLPIFVWLTARAALQPFVAVMQTPVTRDQTISKQYTYTVIEIKLETILYYLLLLFIYLPDMESSNKSKIIRWWHQTSICPDINTPNAPSLQLSLRCEGGGGRRRTWIQGGTPGSGDISLSHHHQILFRKLTCL